MQTSPADETCAQTGEPEVARRLGGGDGEENGEFLKDNFLKHLISTDF